MGPLRISSIFLAGLTLCSFASAHVVVNGPFYVRYGPNSAEEDRTRVLSVIVEAIKQAPDGAVYLCSTASLRDDAPDIVAMTRKSLTGIGLARDRIYVGGTCTEEVTALPLDDTPKEAVFAAIGSREWLESIYPKR